MPSIDAVKDYLSDLDAERFVGDMEWIKEDL